MSKTITKCQLGKRGSLRERGSDVRRKAIIQKTQTKCCLDIVDSVVTYLNKQFKS